MRALCRFPSRKIVRINFLENKLKSMFYYRAFQHEAYDYYKSLPVCHVWLCNSGTPYKNSSGDETANVNFYAVRPEATRIRWNNAK